MDTVGLATCDELATLDPEGKLLLEELRRRGLDAKPVVWNDPTEDWDAYELIVLRTTWDWHLHLDAFKRWVRSLEGRIVNPLPVIEWNLSKRYLLDLESWGIPIIPTMFIGAGEPLSVPAEGDFVLKPAISAGSKNAARYTQGDSDLRAAGEHLARLQAESREVMAQPYFEAADTEHETAAVFLEGEFVHAMRKGPMLAVGQDLEKDLFRAEDVGRRELPSEGLQVAEAAMRAVESHLGPTAYARIDLLPSAGGDPHIVELELIEPSLYLDFFPAGMRAFAGQIERRLKRSRAQKH